MTQRPEVTVLDGGLGTTLEQRGFDCSGPLWSARLLREDPDAIRSVHRDFLEAGADVVITATYQATIRGFVDTGESRGRAEGLLRRAVDLAIAARDDAGRPDALVAASIGPYGAYLADRSEYRGDYGLEQADLVEFHRPRMEVLADAGADLLACETIPSAIEARALLELLTEIETPPAWLTFTCSDETGLPDGTLFEAISAEAAAHPSVIGVGVNCTPPRLVAPLLRRLPGDIDVHLVAYPNLAGEDPEPRRWADLGADWIGGCCGTTPEHVRRLVGSLR